jgi:hypothetical protein
VQVINRGEKKGRRGIVKMGELSGEGRVEEGGGGETRE